MRVECSNCAEIIETTARSVRAPFICDECKESRTKRAEMAPTLPPVLKIEECDNMPCDCNSASIGNTTAMIEQMQDDINELNSRVEADSLLIESLSDSITADSHTIDELNDRLVESAKQAEELGIKNAKLDKTITHLLGKSLEVFLAKEDAEAGEAASISLLEMGAGVMERAHAEMLRLRSVVKTLTEENKTLTNTATHYNDLWREACNRADQYRDEKNELKARNIFARVFNT
jgi:hypothetical protein